MKPLLWMKPSREITPPSAVVFRTCFQLKEKQCFRLRFSADEYADLFLNGEFLTGGPCRSTTTRWHEEEYTCDLVPGEYTLTARLFLSARNWPRTGSVRFRTGSTRTPSFSPIRGNGRRWSMSAGRHRFPTGVHRPVPGFPGSEHSYSRRARRQLGTGFVRSGCPATVSPGDSTTSIHSRDRIPADSPPGEQHADRL